METTTLQQK